MDAIKNDSYATYMAGVPRLIKAGVDRGGTYLSHLDMIFWTEPELGNKKEINIVSWHIKDLTLSKQNTAENHSLYTGRYNVTLTDGEYVGKCSAGPWLRCSSIWTGVISRAGSCWVRIKANLQN